MQPKRCGELGLVFHGFEVAFRERIVVGRMRPAVAMHVIGEETSQRLDVVPAQFRVIVTHRPKYACRACQEAVVQSPAPERLIKGGLPTEAMVAHSWIGQSYAARTAYRQSQAIRSPYERTMYRFFERFTWLLRLCKINRAGSSQESICASRTQL
jgi:transposase